MYLRIVYTTWTEVMNGSEWSTFKQTKMDKVFFAFSFAQEDEI